MYKIAEIEGIGTQFGHQLMASGVNTSKDLMDKCGTVDKKEQLAQATGISTKQLTTWLHQADLMRVSGIGPEFGQLLERSGVESVRELATRNPENITHLLARVNAEKRLTRAVPALKTVTSWVDKAKSMTASAPGSAPARTSANASPPAAAMNASSADTEPSSSHATTPAAATNVTSAHAASERPATDRPPAAGH